MTIPIVSGNAPIEAASTEIAAEIAAHRTVSAVVAWASEEPSSRVLVASIAQDEFTHDFVVSIPGQMYLAYDVT